MSDPLFSVEHMIIECETCETSPGLDHDCMIAFLTDPGRHGSPVYMDADQAAAVDHMVKGGLIPPLHVVPPLEGPTQPPRVRHTASGTLRRVS